MAVLVVADHDNSAIVPIVLNTVTAATAISDDVHVLVASDGTAAAEASAAAVPSLATSTCTSSEIAVAAVTVFRTMGTIAELS